MKHPEREEWVPFVFGEADASQRQQLESHLKACPECREEIESWQRGVGRLDSWKLPRTSEPRPSFAPLVRWAAAAAVVLSIGFGVGRATTARIDAEKVRASVERDIRSEFAQIAREEAAKTATVAIKAFSQQAETRRAADNRIIFAVLDRLETQHATDCLALKKELDTVALNADAGLRQAEEQFVQLADTTHPAAQP
jgi:anti-sigma factor RsiW